MITAVFLQSASYPLSSERGCSTCGVWKGSGLCRSQQISSIQEAAGSKVTQAEGLKGAFTFWTSGSTEAFTLSLEGLQKANLMPELAEPSSRRFPTGLGLVLGTSWWENSAQLLWSSLGRVVRKQQELC